jgi:uncharacterized membrane protein YdjX (TVP38/TMEM64 family)
VTRREDFGKGKQPPIPAADPWPDIKLPGSERLRTPPMSWRELPPLTHVCGAVIILVGLISLVTMLLKIEGQGLLWLMFYSIPANTAISIFPHEPPLILYGQHYNPFAIASVALIGNMIAAVLDYYFFTPVLHMQFTRGYKKSRVYRQAIRWFAVAPFWVVVLFAFTPLPFYLVKILVFSSGYAVGRYLTAYALGRFPRFVLLAVVGEFLRIPTWAMALFFAGVFVVYISFAVKAWWRGRRGKPAA